MEQSSKVDKNPGARVDNVQRSIANITEAVTTIVSRSTDDEFRQKCFSLMKVSNSAGLATHLNSQLQSIARKHIGVKWSAEGSSQLSQPSAAPTSPISQATRSQQPHAHLTPSQSTLPDDAAFCDDFSQFSDVDFFDDEAASGLPATFHPVPATEGPAPGVESSTEPSKSVEVLQSSDEDDWFDKVLDSELFVNEN